MKLSPTLVTFLFEAANFLVLAAALGWLFFKPVRRALSERQERLADEDRQAAEKLADAAAVQQQTKTERKNLQSELDELRSQELAAARKQADQYLKDSRTTADRELAASRRLAARMSDSQRDTLAAVAATSAAEAVGELLKQIDGPDLHEALIRAACQQLRNLPATGRAPVKVESAIALSAEEKAAIDDALAPAVAADYRIVEALGAGVRVSTGQGLIDASSHGLTGFARQALVRQLAHQTNHRNSSQAVDHD